MKPLLVMQTMIMLILFVTACDKSDDPAATGVDKITGKWEGVYNGSIAGSLTISKLSERRIRLVSDLSGHSTTELDVTDTTFSSGGETITEVSGEIHNATTDQVFYARISSETGSSLLQYDYFSAINSENWQFAAIK